MALDICARLGKSFSSTKCPTPGGTNRNSWVFQFEQFAPGETVSTTTGALTSFALVAGEKGIKAIGRPKRGSGASVSNTNENGATEVEQTLIQVFGYNNQLDLNNIQQFLAAGSKVVFQELANGKIRVFFKAYGNDTSKGEETTGTALTDENSVVTTTLVGKEPAFPMFFEAAISGGVTQLEASRAYLDALVTSAEVVA